VVEPGATRLQALCLVDGAGAETGATSAPHRLGGPRQALLTDPPEYWQLGNTPFEREAVYRTLLQDGTAPDMASRLRSAALGGWAAGSADFQARLAAATSRPAQPRARGRPRTKPQPSGG
jgi:putative transposase